MGTPVYGPWWLAPQKNKHQELFALVSKLHHNSSDRQQRNIRNLKLYGNLDMMSLGQTSYVNVGTQPQMPSDRLRLNIASSMVDTSGAKISKMRPRISFLTQGGDPSSQKQAKQLSKFMLGAFYQNNVHELHQQGFRDAQIFDIGAIKHWHDGSRIRSERVMAMELYVDPMDALYGEPRRLYQVKYVAREALKATFKEHATAISMSKGGIDTLTVSESFNQDFVCVIEAWFLDCEGKQGRHVIAVNNETLVDEVYAKDYFPFTFFRWSKPVIGFYGQSLVERLVPIQIEINKMLRIIQRSFHLGSAFKVLLEYGSKISKEQINNDIGALIYYMGTKPEYVAPKVVNDEYFQHLRFLIQSAYEEAGISQMSASSRKPAGLESGKALREYNDVETERFALTSQEYESTYLDTARIYVDLADDLAKENGDFAVTAQSKRFIESIKWADVAPADKNAYVMQMFPTSSLPHEPAGRLAFVQELINSGMIPADWGLTLLDYPDTEAYASLKNAALDDLMDTMEELATGEYQAPEPFQSLAQGIPLMQSAYLRYRRMGLPDTQLDNFRRWIAQADLMLQKARAAQGQQGQPGTSPQLPVESYNQGAPASSQVPA